MTVVIAGRSLTLIVPRCHFVNQWYHYRPMEQCGHQGQEHCSMAQTGNGCPSMNGFWVERERSDLRIRKPLYPQVSQGLI